MKTKIVTVMLLAFFVLSTPGDADSRMSSSMTARGQYMDEVMEMLHETMTILKGLNHKPTKDEKKKLGEMINDLDDLMKSHSEMMKNK